MDTTAFALLYISKILLFTYDPSGKRTELGGGNSLHYSHTHKKSQPMSIRNSNYHHRTRDGSVYNRRLMYTHYAVLTLTDASLTSLVAPALQGLCLTYPPPPSNNSTVCSKAQQQTTKYFNVTQSCLLEEAQQNSKTANRQMFRLSSSNSADTLIRYTVVIQITQ